MQQTSDQFKVRKLSDFEFYNPNGTIHLNWRKKSAWFLTNLWYCLEQREAKKGEKKNVQKIRFTIRNRTFIFCACSLLVSVAGNFQCIHRILDSFLLKTKTRDTPFILYDRVDNIFLFYLFSFSSSAFVIYLFIFFDHLFFVFICWSLTMTTNTYLFHSFFVLRTRDFVIVRKWWKRNINDRYCVPFRFRFHILHMNWTW